MVDYGMAKMDHWALDSLNAVHLHRHGEALATAAPGLPPDLIQDMHAVKKRGDAARHCAGPPVDLAARSEYTQKDVIDRLDTLGSMVASLQLGQLPCSSSHGSRLNPAAAEFIPGIAYSASCESSALGPLSTQPKGSLDAIPERCDAESQTTPPVMGESPAEGSGSSIPCNLQECLMGATSHIQTSLDASAANMVSLQLQLHSLEDSVSQQQMPHEHMAKSLDDLEARMGAIVGNKLANVLESDLMNRVLGAALPEVFESMVMPVFSMMHTKLDLLTPRTHGLEKLSDSIKGLYHHEPAAEVAPAPISVDTPRLNLMRGILQGESEYQGNPQLLVSYLQQIKGKEEEALTAHCKKHGFKPDVMLKSLRGLPRS